MPVHGVFKIPSIPFWVLGILATLNGDYNCETLQNFSFPGSPSLANSLLLRISEDSFFNLKQIFTLWTLAGRCVCCAGGSVIKQ